MDRSTLDAAVMQNQASCTLNARPEVGGQAIHLDRHQFLDLMSVHLGDWLQQVASDYRVIHSSLKPLVACFLGLSRGDLQLIEAVVHHLEKLVCK